MTGTAGDIRNREGHEGYDVHWAWQDGPLPPGLTCVFRVRNEARNLPWVLPPMFEAVQHVVLVDNGSDDGTAEVAAQVADKIGASDRLTLASYPFRVARAGPEHLATPPDSVHSLTHFYNWSMAHVRTAYSMKWDGDMVLTREGVSALADLSWQLEGSQAVVAIPRHPLTVVDDRTAWIDLGMRFIEPWIYPMGPEFTFVKAFEWEVREFPATSERIVLADGLCAELKWLDADEFAHWSSTDFAGARAPRKRREQKVDQYVREGRGHEIMGLFRVDAPPGVHVVDHVTETWLPQAERPLLRKRYDDAAVLFAGTVARTADDAATDPATDPGADDGGEGDEASAGAGIGPQLFRLAGRERSSVSSNQQLVQDPALDARSPSAFRLHDFLDACRTPILVLLHPDAEHLRQVVPDGVTVVSLPASEAAPEVGVWGTILLAVPDRDGLRRSAPALPPTRGAKRIAVWLDEADRALPLVPRGDWPKVRELLARRVGAASALTAVDFGYALSGRDVIAEIGRQAVPSDVGNRGLRVAVHGDATPPPGDVNALRVETVAQAADPERDVPPDVVLTTGPRDVVLPEHPVLARPPLVVDDTSGPLALGPLDERILNPIGFGDVPEDAASGRVVLRSGGAVVEYADRSVSLDLRRGATEELVRRLRPLTGVELSWPETEGAGGADGVALARTVAGLAMSGVPLTSETLPAWASVLLGAAVTAALTAPVDLTDGLAREEHSIVQRRAALDEFASAAWRAKVGAAAGVRVVTRPSVSIVLATKRPANLDFALRQVGRQRGVDLELVLSTHGFAESVDLGRVAELVGPRVTVVHAPEPATTMFGDVLSRGTDAASGDVVLKVDDDDWYGPDVVTDLLLARTYSGADLVGMPAEYLYLEPRRLTVRRNDPSEVYAKFIAGGTMLMGRMDLRELGGFRQVVKYVDATLLSDVLGAGGSIYRTQGLGYVFRRGDSGHTWEADVDFFLDPARLHSTADGFVPSRLLEADPVDLPEVGGVSTSSTTGG